jgi:hypothetical protein
MTCTDFEDNLSAYLEGDLDAATRVAAERHRAGCSHCAGLVADLERIATEARGLPVLRPSRDLWGGIEERIGTPVVSIGRTTTPARRRAWSRWPSLAAAAAALVAVTAGVTYEVATRSVRQSGNDAPVVATVPVVPPAPAATTVAGGEPVAVAPGADSTTARRTSPTRDVAGAGRPSPRPRGSAALVSRRPAEPRGVLADEAIYDQEIALLRDALQLRREELDPATVEVLERNIAVIDTAIRQSREALARDPRSAFLGGQLGRMLDRKVQLLRTAAALPART